ncbi:hypothetical protein [Burkholderia latens]|uniref:Lipoprotein n=1 Tax=Burkholderia latens TaxID=488446 RepID=A0A6H9SXC8_9BURK|nr:hypothetical protein [Burkholderia latens]KAB0638762.1 hypothetical protein F7R21_19570 [Burkholderia latens]VWB49204.1 hypothetical protein BLA24064_02229 [Burkholderia latens]
MSHHAQVKFRAAAIFTVAVIALSGCAATPPAPTDPQLQLVTTTRDDNVRYTKALNAYQAMVRESRAHSRAQILEAYQDLLFQYSVATTSWVRVVYPTGPQTLPPALRPFPARTGTPTLADVNRNYEHALEINVAVWEIGKAANWGKPSKEGIPKYTGPLVFMPVAPPLPPLQEASDPKFARLVAMTKKVEDAQKKDLITQKIEVGQALSASRAMGAARPSEGDAFNPMTGRPYATQQQPQPQEVQRWCTWSTPGVNARVPC